MKKMHNLDIYRDKRSGGFFIIPNFITKIGYGMTFNKTYTFDADVTPEVLGDAVKKSIIDIENYIETGNEKSETAAYTIVTGIKSWSKFVRLHDIVNVTYDYNEYCIEKWERKNDNSYQNYDDRQVLKLLNDCDSSEIGKAIFDAFQHHT